MGITKRKNRATKRSTRRDKRQKKAQPAKAMALSTRDAVKRLPLKSVVTKERSDSPKAEAKASTPVKKSGTPARGVDESARIVAANKGNALPSLFASQMELFATLLMWSPIAMLVRHQTLVADMMFNMRYPAPRQQ